MTGFCVEKIAVDERLRAAGGIVRGQALLVTADASVLAERIVEEARAEADGIVSQARAQAQHMEQAAEADVLKRAAALLKALDQANATVAERAQDMVIDLALNLFDRLVMQTTPRKRIESSLARILREAPPRLIEPVLKVNPDDSELLPEVDWDVKRDASLARGACRLEAANGEWHADFDAAVESLRSAFTVAVAKPAAKRKKRASAATAEDAVS
jgi:flagellar biosynthesis/type III secretory pathway protein FliH